MKKVSTNLFLSLKWTGWPDHGVPKQSSYGVVEQQLELMLKEHESKPAQPIVVHCSAGVGRTGTLIALFNLKLTLDRLITSFLKESSSLLSIFFIRIYSFLADETKKPLFRLSIFGVVRRLREQRWGMVHTHVSISNQFSPINISKSGAIRILVRGRCRHD